MNATMTGAEALGKYGHTQARDGLWTKARSQAWLAVDGGFNRFDPPSAPMGGFGDDPSGGAPWGVLADGRSGWVMVPYRQKAGEWANVSGLHPATHPACFEWVWPDEVVAEMYQFASKAGGENQYTRQEDGSLAKAR